MTRADHALVTRAPLIAFEGIDGSGTTTQARLLQECLAARGIDAHLTAEPSTGAIGTMIRRFLRGEPPLQRAPLALLFAADRLDHLASEILPRLRAGQPVISDRYVYSSLAYQSLDLDLEWIAEINALAPEPDLTIYLRMDPGEALRRVSARGGTLEIFETRAQQDRVSINYDKLLCDATGSGQGLARILRDPAGSVEILREDPPRSEGAEVPDPGGSRAPHCVMVIDGRQDPETVHRAVAATYDAHFGKHAKQD